MTVTVNQNSKAAAGQLDNELKLHKSKKLHGWGIILCRFIMMTDTLYCNFWHYIVILYIFMIKDILTTVGPT